MAGWKRGTKERVWFTRQLEVVESVAVATEPAILAIALRRSFMSERTSCATLAFFSLSAMSRRFSGDCDQDTEADGKSRSMG